jgi:hypothetical protein
MKEGEKMERRRNRNKYELKGSGVKSNDERNQTGEDK